MPKLKLTENGSPVFTDGKLVLVSDDGQESPFDPVGVYSTFGTLRKERDDAKDAAKAAEAALKTFGSTEEDRKKLIDKAKLADSIDAKKLVDAGKVEELVESRLKEATSAWNAEKAQILKEREDAQANVRKHLINGRISASSALKGTIFENAPEAVLAMFGPQFDLDGESIVAYRDGGKKEKLYSRSEPAKVADVDESLQILLTSHPNYSKWKLGVNANGGGAPGGATAASGARAMERTQFFALPPQEQMAFTKSGGKVVDTAA
jgi:hypothetical protein